MKGPMESNQINRAPIVQNPLPVGVFLPFDGDMLYGAWMGYQ
jgi:hypothetical protein